MNIKLHGGDCCGIKTISGLGGYPSMKMAKRDTAGDNDTSFSLCKFSPALNDMRSKHSTTGDKDFFCEAAPSETYARRLSRFIRYLKTHRPHHCIEIVLNTSQGSWVPILKRKGFEKSCRFINSNTGSTVTVWHLVY